MRIRVDVTGDDELRSRLQRLDGADVDAVKRVLKEKTEAILEKAIPLTPVEPEDGGQLRASVRTTRPTQTKSGVISAGVMAGGAPLKGLPGGDVYAHLQHEDLAYKHSTGQAKFIEVPFLEIVESVPDAVLDELDKEMA